MNTKRDIEVRNIFDRHIPERYASTLEEALSISAEMLGCPRSDLRFDFESRLCDDFPEPEDDEWLYTREYWCWDGRRCEEVGSHNGHEAPINFSIPIARCESI